MSDIPVVDPTQEPEYVGVYSALKDTSCQHWVGETSDAIEQCGNEPTHTVVMFSADRDNEGTLHELASCDECGEPEDLPPDDRRWTGEIVD